jgi:hypothetical protein
VVACADVIALAAISEADVEVAVRSESDLATLVIVGGRLVDREQLVLATRVEHAAGREEF